MVQLILSSFQFPPVSTALLSNCLCMDYNLEGVRNLPGMKGSFYREVATQFFPPSTHLDYRCFVRIPVLGILKQKLMSWLNMYTALSWTNTDFYRSHRMKVKRRSSPQWKKFGRALSVFLVFNDSSGKVSKFRPVMPILQSKGETGKA